MTVSLNANALLADVTELNNFTQAGFTAGDYANTLINTASDIIERVTKRKLIAQAYTSEKYSGNGQCKLFLKNYPINSITSLVQRNTHDDTTIQTYSANSDYLFDITEGWVYLRESWVQDTHNYQITYNAGYKVAATEGYITLPYDLRKACADLCMWVDSQKDKVGFDSERIGSYSYSLNSAKGNTIGGYALPPTIIALLAKYIRIEIGSIF